MRVKQLRKLIKRSRYDVAYRAYMAILWKAWVNYCKEKRNEQYCEHK